MKKTKVISYIVIKIYYVPVKKIETLTITLKYNGCFLFK